MWKSKTGIVVLLGVLALLAGCGKEEPDVTGKPAVNLTETDIAQAPALDLVAGEPWSNTSGSSGGTELSLQAYGLAGGSYQMTQGQYVVYSVGLGAGETLSTQVTPTDAAGDTDLYVYRGTTLVKSSYRSLGYVDSVLYPSLSQLSTTYYVKAYCYSGTCRFRLSVAKGDATAFTTAGVYVNQRSFTGTVSTKPCVIGRTLPMGECMCSDASGAMAVVNAGKRRVTEKESVARDLYVNTNLSGGAANRTALGTRLVSVYGFGACTEVFNGSTFLNTLKSSLRSGYAVLFRSTGLSVYGHYVLALGYRISNGRYQLLINDPFGKWVSQTYWYPSNSTSVLSNTGENIWVDFEAARASGASVIVCQ
jgi:hypothetical protein